MGELLAVGSLQVHESDQLSAQVAEILKHKFGERVAQYAFPPQSLPPCKANSSR